MLKKVNTVLVFMLCLATLIGQNPFDVSRPQSAQSEQNDQHQQETPIEESADDSQIIDLRQENKEIADTQSIPDTTRIVKNPFDIKLAENAKPNPSTPNLKAQKEPVVVTKDKKIEPKKDLQDGKQKAKNSTRIWSLVYCLLILGLLAFLVSYNRELISLMFTAILNSNTLRIVFRENYLISRWLFWVYYILFFLTIPFVIYKFLILKTDLNWPFLLLSAIGILIFWYGIRHLSNFFFMHLTNENFDFSFYNYQIILSNIIVSIILIPLVFTLAIGNNQLSELVLTFAFGVVAVMYVYRQLRAIVLSSNLIARNTFHFFIYLCAVEITPLLLIGKFITTL